MFGKAIATLVLLAAVALWVVGAWQVYRANTVTGALLVAAGAILGFGVFTWWQRDPAAGAQGFVSTILEFFSRAP
ncbi:MAG: hypothetical protein QOG63_2653 [Thermoleophilaceae bacterium]|nr:hypothetical protein [Thermoleophilaceae bacterium]